MLIEFKGSSFILLVVYLYEVELEVICQVLEDKIVQVFVFLKYVFVVINVSGFESLVNWLELYKIVILIGLCIIGVSGCKDVSLKVEIDWMGFFLLIEGKEKVVWFVFVELVMFSELL